MKYQNKQMLLKMRQYGENDKTTPYCSYCTLKTIFPFFIYDFPYKIGNYNNNR